MRRDIRRLLSNSLQKNCSNCFKGKILCYAPLQILVTEGNLGFQEFTSFGFSSLKDHQELVIGKKNIKKQTI